MKVSLLAALESPGARAEQIARQLMVFGRVLTRSEIIEKLDCLDLESVRRTGARALRTAPTVAAIGPIGKVYSPDRVTERLRHL
jgi:predicted Zn-dependent peptidase